MILNSIAPAAYREGRERAVPPDATGPVVGSLAKFRGKKAAGTLLAAFRLLLRDVPSPGRSARTSRARDPYGDRRTGPHRTGHADRQGRPPGRPVHIRGMDLFVHDGCPNAVLETMAAGTPSWRTPSAPSPR
ncbi:glycosyltransferase family protein [Streptomyces niveiscabiei]|uniref:Uncharacterized protein n=1 Tax=Streptomyces niveiscabiei TaxID=164115 RepID=A0ABW9HJU5_9ACTN